jgi:hypothetical protein
VWVEQIVSNVDKLRKNSAVRKEMTGKKDREEEDSEEQGELDELKMRKGGKEEVQEQNENMDVGKKERW